MLRFPRAGHHAHPTFFCTIIQIMNDCKHVQDLRAVIINLQTYHHDNFGLIPTNAIKADKYEDDL